MQKTFPIKVERLHPKTVKVIEWKIHNVCNYDCSFCGIGCKDGTSRWLSLDQYKEYADKIISACAGSPFSVQITGGEPTLFPHLIELMLYLRKNGANVGLMTNGSRTLRWWTEFRDANCIDYLGLTYHSEQTANYEHIKEVANLFHNEPVTVILSVTHTRLSLDQAFIAHDYLLKNTGVTLSMVPMAINNEDIYSKYSPEHLNRLKANSGRVGDLSSTKKRGLNYGMFSRMLKITDNTGNTSATSAGLLMKEQQNNFKGWDCFIGSTDLTIDVDIVYRGQCYLGPTQNLKTDQLSFPTDSITCTLPRCTCSKDIMDTKVRTIE